MNPFQPKYLGIPGDKHGMIPEELEKAMSKWSPEECRVKNKKIPKVAAANIKF